MPMSYLGLLDHRRLCSTMVSVGRGSMKTIRVKHMLSVVYGDATVILDGNLTPEVRAYSHRVSATLSPQP
jgi:hypothetical protein